MDLKEFFDEHDIEYWDSGKNVTQGWLNIQCPFCDDESNHLGIQLKDLRTHCWKCGPKNFVRLIKTLLPIDYKKAKSIARSISGRVVIHSETEEERAQLKHFENFVKIPKEAVKHFPKMHREYLRKRGFKPLKTIRKYKLRAVYNYGRYAFRIIIPIFKQGRIASFTSRDVTGYGEPKYKHAGPYESVIKAKDLIYGADQIPKGGDAVLVEGIMDAWKLGKGAICSLGTMISGQQMVQLANMDINRLFLFFDNDRAGRCAAKINGKAIAPLVKNLEIIRMTGKQKDPGELTKEEAYLIMKSLRLKA